MQNWLRVNILRVSDQKLYKDILRNDNIRQSLFTDTTTNANNETEHKYKNYNMKKASYQSASVASTACQININGSNKNDFTTHDLNGDQILEIPFRFTFDVPNLNPEHLSFHVAVGFGSVDGLIEDFDLDGDSSVIADELAGYHSMASELVFSQISTSDLKGTKAYGSHKYDTSLSMGQSGLVSKSIVFVLENENRNPTAKLWKGPIHYHAVAPDGRSDKWMTGYQHNDNSQYLSIREVLNTTIQDFRCFDALEKKKLV